MGDEDNGHTQREVSTHLTYAGSGKSYCVVNQFIKQQIEKGYTQGHNVPRWQ